MGKPLPWRTVWSFAISWLAAHAVDRLSDPTFHSNWRTLMNRETSKSSREFSPRRFRAVLRTFRPADAAFVLHLSQCRRCRELTPKLLELEVTHPSLRGYLEALPSIGSLLDLSRGGHLFALAQATPTQGDLPPSELRGFLRSLRPEQLELVQDLLASSGYQELAAGTLAP